jgi:hypothetical protein
MRVTNPPDVYELRSILHRAIIARLTVKKLQHDIQSVCQEGPAAPTPMRILMLGMEGSFAPLF